MTVLLNQNQSSFADLFRESMRTGLVSIEIQKVKDTVRLYRMPTAGTFLEWQVDGSISYRTSLTALYTWALLQISHVVPGNIAKGLSRGSATAIN